MLLSVGIDVILNFKTNRFNESSACNIEDLERKNLNPKISVTISFATQQKKAFQQKKNRIEEFFSLYFVWNMIRWCL